MENVILKGDCLVELKKLDDCSIDSIVTDPPYELGFMGKKWDASGIAYQVELWEECLRVLKPGGHLLAFGGTRTYHRMVVAIEDAGFEIRDNIHWTYGSGFPKSLNIGKQKGTEQWQGWGTALKPSHEPIVVARKPLTGTVAGNVLEHGTGALNIDGSRIGTQDSIPVKTNNNITGSSYASDTSYRERDTVYTPSYSGRWPANTVLTHSTECAETCVTGCPVLELDKQSGNVKGASSNSNGATAAFTTPVSLGTLAGYGDSGGASRFFHQTAGWDHDWDTLVYISKPSKRERNAGLDGLPKKDNKFGNQKNGEDIGNGSVNDKFTTTPNNNFHPTVKPVALMRYLVKLVTPPNGIVLDPFLGSGTTAVAATLEGFKWIGCEMTEDYYTIIEGRVAHAQAEYKKQTEQLELTNE
jgi:site-specific DNA-methyltransferase (adenine-specific)